MSLLLGLLGGGWRLLQVGLGFVARYPWQAALAAAVLFAVWQTAALNRAQAALINPATRHTWQADYRTTWPQRNAAILFAVRGQGDLIQARVNEATYAVAIMRQSRAVVAQSVRDQATLRATTQGWQAAQRVHAADLGRLAALRRPLTAATICARADEAVGPSMEALR